MLRFGAGLLADSAQILLWILQASGLSDVQPIFTGGVWRAGFDLQLNGKSLVQKRDRDLLSGWNFSACPQQETWNKLGRQKECNIETNK